MDTYEVSKSIREVEENVKLAQTRFAEIGRANPKKDANLAIRKMQRIANLSKTCERLTTVAEKIQPHANDAQKLWLGDAIMDLVRLLERARDLYKEEMQIAERRHSE